MGLIPWPENCSLVTILRDGLVYTPAAEQPIEVGDELLFVRRQESEASWRTCSPPAPASSRSVLLDLDRRSTGVRSRASSHTMTASAAICSGQPMATFATPSAVINGSASSAERPPR